MKVTTSIDTDFADPYAGANTSYDVSGRSAGDGSLNLVKHSGELGKGDEHILVETPPTG